MSGAMAMDSLLTADDAGLLDDLMVTNDELAEASSLVGMFVGESKQPAVESKPRVVETPTPRARHDTEAEEGEVSEDGEVGDLEDGEIDESSDGSASDDMEVPSTQIVVDDDYDERASVSAAHEEHIAKEDQDDDDDDDEDDDDDDDDDNDDDDGMKEEEDEELPRANSANQVPQSPVRHVAVESHKPYHSAGAQQAHVNAQLSIRTDQPQQAKSIVSPQRAWQSPSGTTQPRPSTQLVQTHAGNAPQPIQHQSPQPSNPTAKPSASAAAVEHTAQRVPVKIPIPGQARPQDAVKRVPVKIGVGVAISPTHQLVPEKVASPVRVPVATSAPAAALKPGMNSPQRSHPAPNAAPRVVSPVKSKANEPPAATKPAEQPAPPVPVKSTAPATSLQPQHTTSPRRGAPALVVSASKPVQPKADATADTLKAPTAPVQKSVEPLPQPATSAPAPKAPALAPKSVAAALKAAAPVSTASPAVVAQPRPSLEPTEPVREPVRERVRESAPTKIAAAPPSSQKPQQASSSPTKSNAQAQSLNAIPDPVEKFATVFDQVWEMMLKEGWSIAEGMGTIFCSMPGTEFWTFRPNINVFDSKAKACWKFLNVCATEETDAHAELWELLWTIAKRGFGWFEMPFGPGLVYVRPYTKFEEFLPNVTMFQHKKLAVLKCLEIANIEISLGDSLEGPQVISFRGAESVAGATAAAGATVLAPAPTLVAPKTKSKGKTKGKKGSKKTAVPATTVVSAPVATPVRPKSPAAAAVTAAPSFASPPPAPAPAASFTSPPPSYPSVAHTPVAAVAATPSTATKRKATLKSTPKSTKKTPKGKGTGKRARGKGKTPPQEEVQFQAPEFKCAFGQVYRRLQGFGWYHRSGKFEYDYFSPDYTKETAALGINYFQSSADLEEYLHTSGLWAQIEDELHVEHNLRVAALRDEALARQQQVEERKAKLRMAKEAAAAQAAQHVPPPISTAPQAPVPLPEAVDKPSSTKVKAAPKAPAPKPAPSPVQRKMTPTKRRSSFTDDIMPEMKITIGKIIGKLTQRGWYYRPGRFEYDYFKPNTNPKTAVLNEDYFQSEADLEVHLKLTGLWDDIARELMEEHYAMQEQAAMKMSADAALTATTGPSVGSNVPVSEPVAKKQRIEENPALSEPATSDEPASQEVPASQNVEELTNDIWANSYEFEFRS